VSVFTKLSVSFSFFSPVQANVSVGYVRAALGDFSQKSRFGPRGAMPGLAGSTALHTSYSCRSLEAWKQELHNRKMTQSVPTFPLPGDSRESGALVGGEGAAESASHGMPAIAIYCR